MKKLLAAILAIAMALGMSVAAFAAEAQEVGSDDFPTRVSGKSSTVSKIVKTKKETYKVTGIYYPEQGKEVFNLINKERAAAGLKKLEWESGLVQPAIQRALEQYVLISHTRPNGSNWNTVDSLANGENLAGGDTDAYDVMDGWMNSPGHRSNILDTDFTSVACVCVETDKNIFWVQLFHSDKKVSASGSSSSATESSGAAAKSIAASLDKAKTAAAATSVTLKDTDKLSVATLKAASDWGTKNKKTVSITATTLAPESKNAQGRMTLNPASFTGNKNDLKTGVRADEDSVASVLKSVNKWYPKNAVAIIKLDATGNLGGTVTVGAKVDLTGLDAKKLVFYSYDKSTNKITKMDLGTAGYSIDKNKYLNFTTNKGGYVIITDKELKK